MAHPAKRRRIESLPQFSDEDEIALFEDDSEQLHPEVRDRIASRSRFKSALEDIFEKYGQDFTGIGDEIDLLSGRVIVDNGHLKRIEDEGDTGEYYRMSEEESDGSEGSLFDDTRHKPQNKSRDLAAEAEEEWEEQPLASLHLDQTINKQLGAYKNHTMRTMSQAKDPKWQVPELPVRGTELRYDSEDEVQATVRNFGRLGPKKSKSPGKSLWKHARYPKNYQQISPRLSRTQNIWREPSKPQESNFHPSPKAGRGWNTYNDENSFIPFQSANQTQRTSSTTAEERAIKREAANLLVKTGEWTVLEDQELIRFRLDTPLSFAALATEFPGRTAEMVKHRWRYLKKKMIELPATTAIRTGVAPREAKTYGQHGHQSLSGLQNTAYGSRKSRGKLLKVSSRKHDEIIQRPQSTTSKSLTFQKEPQVHEESLFCDENHADDSRLPSESNAEIEHLRQSLDDNSGSIPPSVVTGQEEELHHALQTSNNMADNLFPPYSNQQMSSDIWNAFPPFVQLQDSGDEHTAVVDYPGNGLEIDGSTNWQYPTMEAPIDSFWIPYDPISDNNALLPDKDKQPSLQQTLVAQPDSVVDHQPDLKADLLHVDSGTASNTIDPAILTSQTGVQANHIPVHQANPTHAHLEHAGHMQSYSMGQVDQSNKDSGVRILSQPATIPDTQDPGSSIAIASSRYSEEHLGKTSQSVLPDIQIPTKLPPNETAPSLQKTGNEPARLMPSSRQSSPLSTLLSSDSRLARSSDMSSSVLVKEKETDKICDTNIKSIEPVLEIQPPVTPVAATKQISPQLPGLSIDTDQIIPPFQSPSRQGGPAAQPSKAIVPTGSAKANMELPYRSPRAISHKQKTQSQEETTLREIAEACNHFQSLYDSFEEHDKLMEPWCKQKGVNKDIALKGSGAPYTVATIRQHGDFFTRPGTALKSRPQVSKKEYKVSKSIARQVQKSAKSLSAANLEFVKSVAPKADKFDLSQQRNIITSEREAALNYMAFRDNDVVLPKENILLRRQREMTPIDTYNYILADPWPVDPLPADRIPGIWKAPQFKNGNHTKSKTEETNLQNSHQDVCPSSPSASSEPEVIDSKAIEKLQDQGNTKAVHIQTPERKPEPTLPLQPQKILRPEPSLIVSKDQVHGQETHAAGAVESRKSNSTVIFPTRDDPQLSRPQSPRQLTLDGIVDTPRKISPIRKAEDIVLEFGKGRPLTKANLLSQDEIPSTSQETVLSFLDSQATQPSRPTATPKSSLLAQCSRARSVSSANTCGVNGFRCEKKVCSKCTPRIVSQAEVDF